MTDTRFPSRDYPDDVTTIRLHDKTVLLVGTAHISQHSTDLVREVIEQEQPDTVCIELDEKRAKVAEERIIGADIRAGNGAALPWEDDSFDIVFQSTVFTSILDDETKQKVADEMKRVCKADGFILWYDFAYNSPKNPDVKGVTKCEIRKLFKDWNCEIRKVTLAPPIARRTVPFCWILAEKLPALNSQRYSVRSLLIVDHLYLFSKDLSSEKTLSNVCFFSRKACFQWILACYQSRPCLTH
ncbi:MAG: methyltransferase domain-containing protein [Candidatus Marinimicrobia bacterium]|nr:methyltransferase domain-containing protein [Candidatus Neomarinimicrobiota bacterium]